MLEQKSTQYNNKNTCEIRKSGFPQVEQFGIVILSW